MRIELLGPLTVRDAQGRDTQLPGARLRTLLTALALSAPHPVSAQQLIDVIWSDAAPANPANALQALSSRLRAVLGRESVELTPAGYRLALSPDEIDLHVFRSAVTSGDPASALAAWHGDVPDLPAFPEEAARLLSLRRDAAEDLLEAQLASGEDPEALLPDLAARTAAEPLRDRPRALLIRALHRAGRTAEALAAFDEGRTLLAEELGADPSPLLRDAHQQALTTAPPARDLRNNLPASLTSFLGREQDLVTVRAALDSSRLVTLIGPGGTGKTRLAVEAARGVPGAVRLVELAPVGNPAEVPTTVLAALHLRESAAATTARPHHVAETTERIIDALGTRDLLLLLDNCEHLVAAAAELSSRLLGSCPGLRILATSREPLAITGEQLHPVDPLRLPADDRQLTVDQALAAPAVRLFADRAAAVRPGWTPGQEDLPAVLAICRALDGQPLAIELAAARIRTLDPAAVAERLAQRFSLLTGGSRTALPRHRTLRAVIDWSWDLLDEPERALLARLSVFSAGATLEAVEGVVPGPDTLDLLASLVDKSLVVLTPTGRYRLLETIRVYAAEKLTPDQAAVTRAAHAAWYLALAERGEPYLYRFGQVEWLGRFSADHDNLITALRISVGSEDAETAVRLVAALGWYLWRRGERGENLPLVRRALGLPADDVPALPRSVAYAITALYSLDSNWRIEDSFQLLSRARELRKRLDDPDAHPLLPMLDVAVALFEQQDWKIYELAAALLEKPDPWLKAAALMFMGYALQNEGRAEESEQHLRRGLDAFRTAGDLWGQAFCCSGLAEYAQWRGDLDEAVRLWEQAIAYEQEMGLSADSEDYRARLVGARHARAGMTEDSVRELEEATKLAMADGSWSRVIATHCALADAYRRTGRPERAVPLLAQGLDLVRRRSNGIPQVRALLLSALGAAEAACGRLDDAEAHHRAALQAAVDSFDGPVTASAVQALAELALRQGEPSRAAELLGAAHLFRGVPDLSSPDRASVEAAARRALGDDAYEDAYTQGRTADRDTLLASLGVTPLRRT